MFWTTFLSSLYLLIWIDQKFNRHHNLVEQKLEEYINMHTYMCVAWQKASVSVCVSFVFFKIIIASLFSEFTGYGVRYLYLFSVISPCAEDFLECMKLFFYGVCQHVQVCMHACAFCLSLFSTSAANKTSWYLIINQINGCMYFCKYLLCYYFFEVFLLSLF